MKRGDLGVDPVREKPGHGGDHALEDSERQKQQPGLKGRIAERVLEVEGHQKRAAEHAQPEDEEGQVGHPEILVFEQAQVDQRMLDREFDDEEDRQPDRGQGEARQR